MFEQGDRVNFNYGDCVKGTGTVERVHDLLIYVKITEVHSGLHYEFSSGKSFPFVASELTKAGEWHKLQPLVSTYVLPVGKPDQAGFFSDGELLWLWNGVDFVLLTSNWTGTLPTVTAALNWGTAGRLVGKPGERVTIPAKYAGVFY